MAKEVPQQRVLGYGEQGWSRHPDMGAAGEAYRAGDKDAFAKAAQAHVAAAQQGQPYTNLDPTTAAFEAEHMQNLALQSGQQKPGVHHRNQSLPHWTDIPLGIRPPPESDQGS